MLVRIRFYGLGILLALSIGSILIASFGPFNPDWVSYLSLYESGGGYLLETQRDLLFTGLIALFQSLGADYVQFRIVIAVFLWIFCLRLYGGKIIRFEKDATYFFSVFLAINAMFFVRSTVIIREGLAMCFFLMGFARLYTSNSDTTSLPGTLAISTRLAGSLCALSSMMVHSGLLPMALILILSFWIDLTVVKISYYVLALIIFLSTLAVLLFMIFSNLTGLTEWRFGDRELVNSQFKIEQVILWIAYGLITWWVYLQSRSLEYGKSQSYNLIFTIQILSVPLLISNLLIIVILLGLSFPTLMVNSFIRHYHLLLSMILLFWAFRSERSVVHGLVCVFLLLDQIRSLVAALLV